MTRLGLREIRKPNIKGAAFLVDSPITPTHHEPNKRVENGIKTVSKVEANRKQSVSESVSKVEANREQTVSKPPADSMNDTPRLLETVSATVSTTVSKVEANREQTVSKVEAETTFSSLVGLQRSILFLVFTECQINRGEISPPLTLEHIVSHCGSTEKTVKNAIARLTQKNFISRANFKNGRGGWTQYRLSKTIYQDMLQHETVSKVVANNKQTVSKVVAKPEAQPEAGSSSSSSSLYLENLKTTTTGDSAFESLGASLTPEWQAVDVSPLTDAGFTQTHLIQIARQGKLTPIEVQDSIHYFAFDLARNRKDKSLNGSPLNFFMGIVRKGIPYAPPDNFESQADEARRKICEFKEQRERERAAEEQKLFDLEFSEWRRGLSADELERLLPDHARRPGPFQDSALKAHFERILWPERAQELLRFTKVDRTEVALQIEQSLQGAEQ